VKTLSHPTGFFSGHSDGGLEPLLAQYWWVLFARGAFAVTFGLTALVWPARSFAVLLLLVAGWFPADGLVGFVQAFTAAPRWPHVLDGSLSIATGAFVIFYPAMTGLVLTLTIAVWLMAKGITQASLAFRFGGMHPGAWLLSVVGIATAGFGAFLAHDPVDALGVITLIAGFAVLLGLAFVALGWWLER
jgi:uncharacterized membrane protein HdeD (DUF308 family)